MRFLTGPRTEPADPCNTTPVYYQHVIYSTAIFFLIYVCTYNKVALQNQPKRPIKWIPFLQRTSFTYQR